MVRTQSPHHAVGLDLSRVLAMSTAIALHVLALALLLIPLSYRPLPPQEKAPPRWTLPERVPAPPPPPEQVVRLPT
ncbi:energy transducer TonB, partial [Xanthomonas sp. Kuri4-1]